MTSVHALISLLLFTNVSLAMDNDEEQQPLAPHEQTQPKNVQSSSRNAITKLAGEHRIDALVILGWSRCRAARKSSDDEFFFTEVKDCEPFLIKRENIGPWFAKYIRRFEKWQKLRAVFAQQNIELMSEESYQEHLVQVLKYAPRIRRTPSYAYYSCAKTIKRLEESLTVDYTKEVLGRGLQKVFTDPVLYAGVFFSAGMCSVGIKLTKALIAKNKDETEEKEEIADYLNGDFWTWDPQVGWMMDANCGAEYSQQIATNYSLYNNTIVRYPSTTNAYADFCASMTDALKDFMNDATHAFRPPYPVSNIDVRSFWYSCVSNLDGNITKHIGHYGNATQVYPILNANVPKLSHKGIFTNVCDLSIPDDFPKTPAHMEIEYKIVDTNCYLNHIANKAENNILNYMYDYYQQNYGFPTGITLMTLDAAVLILSVAMFYAL